MKNMMDFDFVGTQISRKCIHIVVFRCLFVAYYLFIAFRCILFYFKSTKVTLMSPRFTRTGNELLLHSFTPHLPQIFLDGEFWYVS